MKKVNKNTRTASSVSHLFDVEGLLSDVRRYSSDFQERKFLKALSFAAKAHEGQFRKDGNPYISHPIEIVKILSSLHADEDTLIAALLHDVPEDTQCTLEDIEKRFGKKISFLVDGVTKLSKVYYQHDMAKRQIESLKKLFLHTAKDPRIILIKLADRLHNMRTLSYIDKQEKRERIAKETLEIFVPVAHLLGIEEIKNELEDLCLYYIHPEEYRLIAERVRYAKEKNERILKKTLEKTEKALQLQGIQATVYGRSKNLFSYYKKIFEEKRNIHDIDQIISLRIIVSTIEDCYHTLGILHNLFKPKPGFFKDYIAVPKKNNYQSLHTTVFGVEGFNTEFQIRTHQMHQEAEYGITTLFFQDITQHKSAHLEKDQRAHWLSEIIEAQQEDLADDLGEEQFITNLKGDISDERIYIFTPKGDIIDLPSSATCIDFAYQLGSHVGNQSLKAEVNGEILPMTSKLHHGDIVTIITSDIPKGPHRSWLAFAKTAQARRCIIEYFKQTSLQEKVNFGRMLLQKELDRTGHGLIEDIPHKKIRLFYQKNSRYKDLEDVYKAIGEGTLSPVKVVSCLYPGPVSGAHVNRPESSIAEASRNLRSINIKIRGQDSEGQLQRILQVFYDLNIPFTKARAYLPLIQKDTFICRITACVENYNQIATLFENLEQTKGVEKVERTLWQRTATFSASVIATFALWAFHPYILHYMSLYVVKEWDPIVASILLYVSIFMLFLLVFLLKRLTQRSFPELRETKGFWAVTFALNIFALITLFAEVYFFNLNFNWVHVFGLVLLIFAYLLSEYIYFKDRLKSL